MNFPETSGKVTPMNPSGEWEQMWLPIWPYAADDYARGIYRMARGEALQRRYVQANPDVVSNLLVVDVDHPDAALRALSASRSHPMPTAVVENRRNGHAHAVWALQEPVTRTEYARRKPLAFAAAVTEGLRRAVDGDQGYNGLLTKNPAHDEWVAHWIGSELRSLDQLAEGLGEHMPPAGWRRQKARKANPVGLGRNCDLFDTARTWAYREVRKHWGDPDGLGAAIHDKAALLNIERYAEPLPASEVRAIAASITRWITTRSRMWADGPVVYEATFSTIQSHRGRRARPGRRTVTEKQRAANASHGFQPKVDEAALIREATR